MACFSDDVKKILLDWGRADLCEELEGYHQKLVERRVEFVEYGDPTTLSAKALALKNCQLLRQALLHRAERLMVSTGTALLDGNAYSLALIVRGHVETTAVLGYFCHRVRSLAKENITFDNFAADAANTVAGGKHDLFAERGGPKNILTMIPVADKFLHQEITKDKKNVLQEGYAWLSEFAHPNFCSHSNAFKLDKATGRMVFRHEDELRKEDDLQHVCYLAISAQLFVAMYDVFGAQAEKCLIE